MSVCTYVCTLVASHQTLFVSASTLYESELQYSVGGAGIGYPPGGSSTHIHTHAHTLISMIILVRTLSNGLHSTDTHREGLKVKLVIDQM